MLYLIVYLPDSTIIFGCLLRFRVVAAPVAGAQGCNADAGNVRRPDRGCGPPRQFRRASRCLAHGRAGRKAAPHVELFAASRSRFEFENDWLRVRTDRRLHPRSRPSTGSSPGFETSACSSAREPAIVIGREAGGPTLFLVLPFAVEPHGLRAAAHLAWAGPVRLQRTAARGRLSAPSERHRTSPRCGATSQLLRATPSSRPRPDRPARKCRKRSARSANPLLRLRVAPHAERCLPRRRSADDWESFYTAKRSSATRARPHQAEAARRARRGPLRRPATIRAEIARTLDTLIEQKSHLVCPHGRRQHVRAAGLPRRSSATLRPARKCARSCISAGSTSALRRRRRISG